jgi:hypothetical protein
MSDFMAKMDSENEQQLELEDPELDYVTKDEQKDSHQQ